MEGASAITENMPGIVVFNAAVVGLALIVGGWLLGRGALTEEAPDGRQNAGEWILEFFVGKARGMAHGPERDRTVRSVAPLLASFFLFIFVCNLFGVLPIPVLNTPPTSYFSVTLALALASVFATLTLSGLFKGFVGSFKHLFWPNPMQWVSEFTDVISLSLRLFGNIAGEHMTLVLVAAIVPIGIPLILHSLGMIPAFVQALVFTLLTASFMASAIHHEEKKPRKRRRKAKEEAEAVPEVATEGGTGR